MDTNLVKRMAKVVLFILLCITCLSRVWKPVTSAQQPEVWDLNKVTSVHSLVDWQVRAKGEVWLNTTDEKPCKQGQYGLWCNFEDATTKERFWLGPWVSELGDIIVVDSFCVQNHTSDTWESVAMFHNGVEWLNLANDVFVPRYKWICLDHSVVLQSGYRLGAWFRGATESDDLKVNILWHKVQTSP